MIHKWWIAFRRDESTSKKKSNERNRGKKNRGGNAWAGVAGRQRKTEHIETTQGPSVGLIDERVGARCYTGPKQLEKIRRKRDLRERGRFAPGR